MWQKKRLYSVLQEGIVFFTHTKPPATENEVVCKIIRRLHG